MSDDPRLNNDAQSNDPKRGSQDAPPDPNGRLRGRLSSSSNPDLGEFLDRDVYPALVQRLDTAFPEYGFRRGATSWVATQEATRDLPGAPRPDRVYCYDNRPWGLVIQGGSFVRFVDLVNGGTKPTGGSFPEAVRKLADLAGVRLPEREISPQEADRIARREVRRSALETVTAFCHEALFSQDGRAALSYLKGRGLAEEAIRELRLGFYPSRSVIEDALRQAGHTPDTLKEVGLLRPDFEGRAIYPWADATGQPLTLYGDWPERPVPANIKKLVALTGEGTKASPLCFDRARAARERDLVLVEGAMDAILPQAFGDTRVIGCLGAQLSGEQVKTLVRYGVASVTICLDPDGAGDRGTLACIRSLHGAGIRAFVAPRLPDGLDPDQFLRQHGIDAWREHIGRAVHAYRFQARSIIDTHMGESWTDRTLAACLDDAIAFDAKVKDPERSPDLDRFFWDEILRATGTDKDAVSARRDTIREKLENELLRQDYKKLIHKFCEGLQEEEFGKAREFFHREMDLLRATERKTRAEPVRSVAEELDTHEAYLQQWRGQEFIGLPQRTLSTLDKRTRGLRGLILLAAAPNVGKTTLAVQLGLDAVLHNPDAAFLFVSLEMPRRDMLTRMKSRLSELTWETLVFGSGRVNRRLHDGAYFTQDELSRLAHANAILRDVGKRIRILDDKNFPEPTLEKVLGQIEDLKATTGTTRVFVLVDYLQVWPVSGASRNIRSDIDADKWRIGQMKALQGAIGSDPVLVISEARKPSDKDAAWGGGLADVMGSARGTYTPDMVLLLRPWSDAELALVQGPIEGKDVKQVAEQVRATHACLGYALQRLSIVKGRDGTTRGDIELSFFFGRSAFEENSGSGTFGFGTHTDGQGFDLDQIKF